MKLAVRYYTRSGNTKKLAEAIAGAISAEAKSVDCPLEEKADILFLGSSYYAFDVDEAIKKFIAENKANIGEIVCFGTSAMMKSVKKPVSKAAKASGVAISSGEFHCRGQFGKIHKGRPNAEDLSNAAQFARRYL